MMFLVGYLWFDEVLTWQQGLAGLMVLGAILLVRLSVAGLAMVRRKRRWSRVASTRPPWRLRHDHHLFSRCRPHGWRHGGEPGKGRL